MRRIGWAAALLPLSLSAADVEVTLTCEKLFAVAQASVRYRDEGYALPQVLAALEAGEGAQKLSLDQRQVLGRTVSAAYLSNATPEEVALECVKRRKRE